MAMTDWYQLVEERFHESIQTTSRFFEANDEQIAQVSLEMAKRFRRGGRLFAFGNGPSATDAQHVSVEFVHPIIVGKRALPALALTNDIASLTGLMQSVGASEIFARQLQVLGNPHDMALGLMVEPDAAVLHALQRARQMGMLTIALCGSGGSAPVDFCLVAPSRNPQVIQEAHETAYHVLWETVHVFFDHEQLLSDARADLAMTPTGSAGRDA